VHAQQAGGAGQQVGAADVGMNPMPTSGHAQLRGVGDDAHTAVRADADAAAHHDAVHHGDVGLGVVGDVSIQHVLVVPEGTGPGAADLRVVVDRDDVTARAQARSPAPVSSTVCTASSFSHASSARARRPTITSVRELMALGRFRTMRPTPVLHIY